MPRRTERHNGQASIVLASSSPQRADVLDELGISYGVLAVDVQEAMEETAAETVFKNAWRKVLAGLGHVAKGVIVVGADTVLDLEGTVLGKPLDPNQAASYLRMLSGRRVCVNSGVAIVRKGKDVGTVALETAVLKMKTLTDEEIKWYVGINEPMGRAGAIGVSRYGELLVEQIEGSYSCISGLPKAALLAVLIREVAPHLEVLPCRPPPSLLGQGRVRICRIHGIEVGTQSSPERSTKAGDT